MEHGTLNISSLTGYTRLDNTTDYAGYNYFGNATYNLFYLDEVDNLEVEDGYNNIIMNPNPLSAVFGGSLTYGSVDISNNYWEMQLGGSTVNYLISPYFDLIDISNSNTAVTFSASPNLSSSSIQCSRWDGEPVADEDWDIFYNKKNNVSIIESVFEMYPIPCSDEIKIRTIGLDNFDIHYAVKATDVTGRIFHLPLTGKSEESVHAFNMSKLPVGIYIISIEHKEKIIHKQRVVVVR